MGLGQLIGILLGQILTGKAPSWLTSLFDFFRGLVGPSSRPPDSRPDVRVFEWIERRGPWLERHTMMLPHLSEAASSGDQWASQALARIAESQARMSQIDALLAELAQGIAASEAAAKSVPAQDTGQTESQESPDVPTEGWYW